MSLIRWSFPRGVVFSRMAVRRPCRPVARLALPVCFWLGAAGAIPTSAPAQERPDPVPMATPEESAVETPEPIADTTREIVQAPGGHREEDPRDDRHDGPPQWGRHRGPGPEHFRGRRWGRDEAPRGPGHDGFGPWDRRDAERDGGGFGRRFAGPPDRGPRSFERDDGRPPFREGWRGERRWRHEGPRDFAWGREWGGPHFHRHWRQRFHGQHGWANRGPHEWRGPGRGPGFARGQSPEGLMGVIQDLQLQIAQLRREVAELRREREPGPRGERGRVEQGPGEGPRRFRGPPPGRGPRDGFRGERREAPGTDGPPAGGPPPGEGPPRRPPEGGAQGASLGRLSQSSIPSVDRP